MERANLRVGMAVGVKPAGGHRRSRSTAQRPAVVLRLHDLPRNRVEVRFADTNAPMVVRLERLVRAA